MKTRIAFFIVLFCLAGALFAADARVTAALESLDINYEVDDDGDFRLIYSTGDGRTQLVWVSGDTESFHDMEIREIFSYAYDTDGSMPASVARKLLQANANYKIGAWEMRDNGNSQFAIFTARIEANAHARELENIIMAVSVTADEMEKDLLGTDEW